MSEAVEEKIVIDDFIEAKKEQKKEGIKVMSVNKSTHDDNMFVYKTNTIETDGFDVVIGCSDNIRCSDNISRTFEKLKRNRKNRCKLIKI